MDASGLNKVTLTKAAPLVSLTDQGAVTGHLQINLHWTMREADLLPHQRRGGLLRPSLFRPMQPQASSRPMVNVDLDLGCMYELADGSRGVVQPLGNLLGDLQRPPFIKLSGDDRYGAPSGETMYVNLDKRDQFKRLLIFVYIYDGTPAFDRTHAVVTLFPYVGPRIEVMLDERAPQARSCAVIMIENKDGRLTVRREVRYVYGFQAELDRLYGFGMQWQRGYKTPQGTPE
ncbi:TerD family protein [Streptacidiphilus griseoplanus]|uniref:TerD family protein n=1 Tax=Peterkaempfera griseoplana TaxID=66896 RepID=UPI001FDF9AF8|nr:Tellurium resistance [Peterkaempfera griseoplana]